MMGIAVSFCITVYNQSELVKRCIDSIVAYKGNNIEIVISDDGSTEDIKTLIEEYHDERIKYYVNSVNLGHDRNIVNALSKANGKYAFLLRTRDMIIPSAIPLIIGAAEKGQASYITGEAVNQEGDIKIRYSKSMFKKGDEALEANFKLFIHPSGNMYRVSDLELSAISSFLDENNVPKDGFIVHSLLRMQLALKGNFRLISPAIWIYADTETSTDKAVNRSANGKSVYDPCLVEKRFLYETRWAKQVLGEYYYKAFFRLVSMYLDLVTWGVKLTNADKRTQKHYGYEAIPFSVSRERKRFRIICDKEYVQIANSIDTNYKRRMGKIFLKNSTVGAVKYLIRKCTYGSWLYNKLSVVYKKICIKL
ncbi:MAG: glycosyltransferase family 2 protein [Lachnospiraceae bacterium]|nr:glycosyltransferase family 2 protein [Lachnospiraceae bacterium]